MARYRAVAVISCWLMLAGLPAQATQLVSSDIDRVGERFRVRAVVKVRVPAHEVMLRLRDPDQVKRYNPQITAVEHLPPGRHPGTRRFIDYTTACVWFFCVDYRNIMQLVSDERYIRLTVENPGSDFRYGKVVWEIHALGDAETRVSFDAELEPSFWVPPALGTTLLGTQTTGTIYRMMELISCEYRGRADCESRRFEDEYEF